MVNPKKGKRNSSDISRRQRSGKIILSYFVAMMEIEALSDNSHCGFMNCISYIQMSC
jgi:hypothetical protein